MNPTKKFNLILPNWPAPKNIVACTTTRTGGVSTAPYDSFNLADHVGDAHLNVLQNRQHLNEALQLPSEPCWLQQTHSTIAVEANEHYQLTNADASFSTQANRVCVVLTADCLPVLLCDKAGTMIAAIHAGWRGLADGVIENTLAKLPVSGDALLAWLGPAIGAAVYEVGDEVYDAFIAADPEAHTTFHKSANHRWLVDLYAIARQRLTKQGVTQIYGGDYCTYSQPDLFYSFRRDGVTGRMATLIYFANCI